MKNTYVQTAMLLCLCGATLAYAQPTQSTAAVPKLVRFSGSFHPANGVPAQSVESVILAVYRDQTGGNPLWREIQNVEVDAEGHYSLLLGSTRNDGMPLDLFSSGEPRWLGVQFNRPGETEQPRVLLASVPYALKASDAETLGGRPASAYLLAGSPAAATEAAPSVTTPVTAAEPRTKSPTPKVSTGTPNYIAKFVDTTDVGNSIMYQNGSNIGVGTTAAAIAMDIRPTATSPFAQLGVAQTVDYMTLFASDTYGPAFYWDPAKALRFGPGGPGLYNPYGFHESMRIQPNGYVGIGTTAPAIALDVRAGQYPQIGVAQTKDYLAMFASDVVGPALYWDPAKDMRFGPAGTGLYNLTPPPGFTESMRIQSSTGNVGIGTTTPGQKLDVKGNINVSGGETVAGSIQFADTGVAGQVENPLLINAVDCCNYGNRMIWAHSPTFPGWGIYYDDSLDVMHWQQKVGGTQLMTLNMNSGDLDVTGTLTAGAKDFKIDHPLDPTNKYLYHGSVESSELMNIYTGNATLDGGGRAVVSLPNWFEAVNTDFRYQLTSVGAPAPNLHIAQEIANHEFQIAGGAPGMKVSWQVTAVRHDAYAQKHPLVVEVDKAETERGHYLHPDAFGQPRLTQEQMLQQVRQ